MIFGWLSTPDLGWSIAVNGGREGRGMTTDHDKDIKACHETCKHSSN